MIKGCLNTGIDANFSQGNNVWEIADGPGYNWCNVACLVMGWAAVTPFFDHWRNPWGGTWRPQPEDVLAEYFRDEINNWPKFIGIRLLNLKKYPPEQVPQYHPIALKEVLGVDGSFEWGTTFDLVAGLTASGNAVELCLKNPGHYILANQYDDEKKLIGFKDPAPEVVRWKAETLDANGNKWFGVADMMNIESFYVTIKKR